MTRRLVLIDGHALAYRAYFALLSRRFQTADGRPTGAVYGFLRSLIEALRTFKPACMAVTFDRPKPTFRHEAYTEYKAHRKRMDDDLIAQMAPIRAVVRAFGLPIYELDGYEADDVIGTLARHAAADGQEVLILTGDRDAFQLVTEQVKVVLPRTAEGELEPYGPAEVEARMGVPPRLIIDLKGLMGDASDNIPGVPGVGEKTALKLLQEHGSLEAALAAAPGIKGKLGERLREHADLARLSRDLATIRCDAPIEVDLDACQLRRPAEAELRSVLESLEFHTVVKQLPSLLTHFAPAAGFGPPEAPAPAPEGPTALELSPLIVDGPEALETLRSALEASDCFSYDTETDGLKPTRCDLVGLAIALNGPKARECLSFYVPVAHEAGTQLPWDQVRAALAPAFKDPEKLKIAHHAKFDALVLERHGLPVAAPGFDTMLADYLVYSGRQSHGLKELAIELLGIRMTEITELIGKGAKAITMKQVPIPQAAAYAAADVAVTLELHHRLAPQLLESRQDSLFHEVEMPLIRVLVGMERHGVMVDARHLQALGERLSTRLAELEASLYEQAGETFNLNSPRQLGTILFERLQLPVVKRTKTGPSTDASVLEELAGSHPIVAGILEYRQLTKLKSTYVDALPSMRDADGLIHTSFNQTVAETGRLSSSDPNLQNIPVRTELGREIRRAFVPSRPGWVMLSADYSQIELRILAHITEDPSFLQAFREDQDIHAVTAAEIFGVPLSEVTPEMRRRAKTTNFGVIYGQTDYGLSRALGIPRAEARDFIQRFNARYAGIQRYMSETLERARESGYVETLSGRRRYVPDVRQTNRTLREIAERMAINAPIQGTAADIIKIAMVKLAPALAAYEAALLLQVHDELLLEVSPAHAEAVSALVRTVMEQAFPLQVPLKVDLHLGPSWMEAKA